MCIGLVAKMVTLQCWRSSTSCLRMLMLTGRGLLAVLCRSEICCTATQSTGSLNDPVATFLSGNVTYQIHYSHCVCHHLTF